MKPLFVAIVSLAGLCLPAIAQTPEIKFIADTIVVQADGKYEADPDIATVTFNISSQEKEMRRAYDAATQSVQRIVAVAEKNNLKKSDISTGFLSIAPIYEGDRKKRARSYIVRGQIVLRIRDFSRVGAILDDSVEDGVADLRSLTYSLEDEEAAKQKAVADAMRHAVGRATVAMEQKGQKLGTLRYMSLDVKQLVGVSRLESYGYAMEAIELQSAKRAFAVPPPPPPPPVSPEKIAVMASVQCAFQIQ
jgi:uncharacterized protein YggE